MLEQMQMIDHKFIVVAVIEIRDALLRVSVLVKIRGCGGLFLDVRQPLRPRWPRVRTVRLLSEVCFLTINGANAS